MTFLKKIIVLSALGISLSTPPAYAGGPQNPYLEPEVIIPNEPSADRNVLFLLALIVLVGLVVNSGSTAVTGGAPII